MGTQLAGAIQQLTTAGQGLSEVTTESAASLEETVASLEELNSMVKLNTENAEQAAKLSSQASDTARTGEVEINKLINAMTKISQSSKKIAEITSVIDDISFQTNLLALNAAVEAAKDINVLIQESVGEVSDGAKIAESSGEVLTSIVASVKKVADLNSEIATASLEQTNGLKQISVAMNQLDSSGQSNAASAEEIAASAEEISAQANQMQQVVGDLKFVVSGERI